MRRIISAAGKAMSKYAHEDGRLDEARLRLADVEDVLEMLVQDIQHGMAKSPDEKQGGDHEEREQ